MLSSGSVVALQETNPNASYRIRLASKTLPTLADRVHSCIVRHHAQSLWPDLDGGDGPHRGLHIGRSGWSCRCDGSGLSWLTGKMGIAKWLRSPKSWRAPSPAECSGPGQWTPALLPAGTLLPRLTLKPLCPTCTVTFE